MTIQTKLYCSVAFLALAACGGGGSDGGGGSGGSGLIEPGEVRFFADLDGDGEADQTFSELIAAGGAELVAREVNEASWSESFPDGGAYSTLDGTVSFEGDGNDLLVTFGPEGDTTTIRIVDAASIDEGNIVLNPGGPDGYYFDLFIRNATLADLFDDTNSLNGVILGLFYADNADDFGFETRAVIGLETTEAYLDQLAGEMATATYNGFGSMEIRQADAGFVTYNASLDGNVEITADFGAGTIGGSMDNLTLNVREDRVEGVWTVDETTGLAGSLNLEETTFTDNAFKGEISPDATLTEDDPAIAALGGAATYSGFFSRADASAVGGAFEGAGTYEGTDYLAIGTWAATVPSDD